jgi:hypothetical protein
MLIVVIMTLYQVVTYEHCFGYNLVSISFDFFYEIVALLELIFCFQSFYFMRVFCVLMFDLVKWQIAICCLNRQGRKDSRFIQNFGTFLRRIQRHVPEECNLPRYGCFLVSISMYVSQNFKEAIIL